MSLSTFVKIMIKAFRFTVSRPIQRFNIENRSKNYLGPDAKKFMPAPRAIGSLTQGDGPQQYPHLIGGFKSVRNRRLEALKHPGILAPGQEEPTTNKSYSVTKTEDDLVIKVSQHLAVTKNIKRIEPITISADRIASLDGSNTQVLDTQKSELRLLPTRTNLPMDDARSIWLVSKTPPGRLDVNKLQELMLNKLADSEYWTPERIAKNYGIKEEYAEKLISHLCQIRILVSPKLKRLLDYVGKNDSNYQKAQHLIYQVDKSLRTEQDKMFDRLFDPETEQLDPAVREIIDEPKSVKPINFIDRKPEPLRLIPSNKPDERISSDNFGQQQKRLAGPEVSNSDHMTSEKSCPKS